MRIAGVDPDTKQVAIAWFDGDGGSGYFSASPSKMKQTRAEHRFLPLMAALAGKLSSAPRFDWVYIEKPVYTRNPASTIAQGAVLGGVRLELWRRNISHSLVDSGTWKKGIGIGGRASKEEMSEWASVHLNLRDVSQDIIDASCIAFWGSRLTIPQRQTSRLGAAHASCVRQLSYEEAAWMGAMIDADGTLSWTKRSDKNTLYQVAVGNTEVEIVATCIRLVGDGGVSGGKPGTLGILPVWVWHLANQESLLELLPQIIPYLAGKRSKAEEMMIMMGGTK